MLFQCLFVEAYLFLAEPMLVSILEEDDEEKDEDKEDEEEEEEDTATAMEAEADITAPTRGNFLVVFDTNTPV
jgi:hypothetical protein